MTIEDRLKEYICKKYKNLRNFVNTSGIDMPYSTLDGILKRGIGKSSIDNVFKLCDVLEISADALCDGEIVPKQLINSKEYTEYDYIFELMTIDGKPLNDYEQWHMKRAFHDQADRIRESRARFEPEWEFIINEKGKFAIEKNTNRTFYVTKDDVYIPFKDFKRVQDLLDKGEIEKYTEEPKE